MKYASDEALEKIFTKSKEIRAKRERRTAVILSTVTAVLSILLIGTVQLLKGQGIKEASATTLGAFLLPSEAGGYVLAGVLAFLLGVAVAWWAVWYRGKVKGNRKDETKGKEQL